MKRLLVILAAVMFAGLSARGETCCGKIINYICWGSFYRDVFVCGWNHVPSPDEMPGVGYDDPGCRMLFTELVECDGDCGYDETGWMKSPCGDYYTVYRDDVAIAKTGWLIDGPNIPGRPFWVMRHRTPLLT